MTILKVKLLQEARPGRRVKVVATAAFERAQGTSPAVGPVLARSVVEKLSAEAAAELKS